MRERALSYLSYQRTLIIAPCCCGTMRLDGPWGGQKGSESQMGRRSAGVAGPYLIM